MSDQKNSVTPKDAAAVIMFSNPSDPKVFWVKRSLQLKFMGGFQAFPGGQRDASDDLVPVLNCEDAEAAAMRVCAARELFEETGVLIARGVENLPLARLNELREELETGKIDFPSLLKNESLTIDASDFAEIPRWITPPPAPKRFNTFFFVVWLPTCADGLQQTKVIAGELESGEWHRPHEAVNKWRRGDVLIPPPVLVPLLELEKRIEGFVERANANVEIVNNPKYGIDFRFGFKMMPLRSPTIPPATHTNCYLIGNKEIVIIDPGSPYKEEQARLDFIVENLIASGSKIREILITHLHPDHIGGVMHLSEKFGIPVATHRLTAEAIADTVRVDRLIEDDEIIELSGEPGWRLKALWSPGHARGHLSFWEERTGSLITGDCIVGMGTVVIAPPEGNMQQYLASLNRLLKLPKLTALFPAHGPVLADARGKIEEYIQHRFEREAMILGHLKNNPDSIPELVKKIYVDVPESLHQLAGLSVLAHLEKLEAEGVVRKIDNQYEII